VSTCLFCGLSFEDRTKNKNRTCCGSKDCLKKKSQKYRQNQPAERRQRLAKEFRARNPDYLTKWREANKDRDRELNRRSAAKRYKENINYRLSSILRHRLYQALKGEAKIGSHIEFLGCSIEDFKVYIESLFEGTMSWDNYGLHGWHIDHKMPMASFNLSVLDQLKKACHYTNLQPMLAKDNWKKGDKLI
jgi:hypothetical protein